MSTDPGHNRSVTSCRSQRCMTTHVLEEFQLVVVARMVDITIAVGWHP